MESQREPNHRVVLSPKLQTALPYLALALGTCSIALAVIFAKWANAPGTVIGFYRMAIAAALFAFPFFRQAKRSASLSRRHVALAMLAGVFFACDTAVFYTSIQITSVANATLFGNTSPVWVGIGAMLLFKERLRPAFWVGVLLAMVGVGVIVGQDFITHPSIGAGDLFGLSAGLFYGSFFLAAQRAREGLDSLSAWWISAATSAATGFGLSFIFSQPLIGYSNETYFHLVMVAFSAQIGGWLAINYALGHLRASIVSPTMLGQPVVTALLAVPLLGQVITPIQVIGGLIVIGGIWLVYRANLPERASRGTVDS